MRAADGRVGRVRHRFGGRSFCGRRRGLYDGDSHGCWRSTATSGRAGARRLRRHSLGGALVGACHWDVKKREGWVSFFVPEQIERAATAEEVSASALWPAFVERRRNHKSASPPRK